MRSCVDREPRRFGENARSASGRFCCTRSSKGCLEQCFALWTRIDCSQPTRRCGWGDATEVVRKFVAPSDPASQWTGKIKGPAFFAHANNYPIDVRFGIRSFSHVARLKSHPIVTCPRLTHVVEAQLAHMQASGLCSGRWAECARVEAIARERQPNRSGGIRF